MKKQPEPANDGIKNRVIGLEYHDADDLISHPKNWRQHPDEQKALMSTVLKSVGVAGALIAYRSEQHGGKLTVIDGHLRKELLTTKVPVLVLDVNDVEAEVLLGSYDPVGLMAVRDDEMYAELLKSISAHSEYADLVASLDPDFSDDFRESLESDEPSSASRGQYPLVASFDEAYNHVIIFTRTDMEFAVLATALDLQPRQDRKRIGRSHVLTFVEFMALWKSRSSS